MPDNYRPSQGNPFYNPLMSTPDWGAGIRDTLNQMWSYRKYQEELDENKRRWEAENALRTKQVSAQAKYWEGGGRDTAMDQRRELANERVASGTWTQEEADEYTATGQVAEQFDLPPEAKNAIVKAYPQIYKTEKDFDASPLSLRKGIVEFYLRKLHEKPEAPEKPTPLSDYEKRLRDIDAAEKSGRLTPEQADQARKSQWGISPPEVNPQAGTATGRQANLTFVDNWYKNILADKKSGLEGDKTPTGFSAKSLRAIVKSQEGNRPTSPDGMILDVPRTYNVAKMDIADGFPTKEGMALVDSLDKHRALFEQMALNGPYKTFDAFMQSGKSGNPAPNSKTVDKNLIKYWYEVYRDFLVQ